MRAWILLAALFALAACSSGSSDGSAAPAAREPPVQPVDPAGPQTEPPPAQPRAEEPPVEPMPETVKYSLQRVPSIYGGDDGQVFGRSINNHGHVAGSVWFWNSPQPYSIGIIWFGGRYSIDANELIRHDDPFRSTTLISDVLRINDGLYMVGVAGDPTVLDWRGRPTPFGYALNGDTGRLHIVSDDGAFEAFMAPDGQVFGDELEGQLTTVWLWNGEYKRSWQEFSKSSLWIDPIDCTILITDDRGIVHDFGRSACWARFEQLLFFEDERDPLFLPEIEGRERLTFTVSLVMDMNDRDQLLVEGCDGSVCGLYVLTPLTMTEH